MQVLGARGSDLERAFSYGVVRQLFEPFLARLAAEERAELLSGPAALAKPLFEPERLLRRGSARAAGRDPAAHDKGTAAASVTARRRVDAQRAAGG